MMMDSTGEIIAETKSKQEMLWINICKGITIFLVILGHISGIPAMLRSVIYSFHLPIFFLLSGYLVQHYRIKETFSCSLKTLIKPYVIICIVEALLSGFSEPDFSTAGNTFLTGLDNMVVGMSKTSTAFQKYGSVWLVWFVVCLFAARLIYVAIRNISCSRLAQNFIIVSVACVGCHIGEKIAFLPWSLDVSMVAIIFIAGGDALSHWQPEKKQLAFVTLVALGVWILLLSQGAQLELAVRKYPLGILCFICAFAGSLVVMVASKSIEKIPVFSSIWAWMGKNSMIILAVYCLAIRFFRWNEWVYQPIGIQPGWKLSFVIHIIMTILITWLFLYLKKHIRELVGKISRKEKEEIGHLAWPDVAKGICILSVIIGHLGSAWINRIVFIYHLPVFFLLAGYFLKKKETEWTFIRKKAKRLLAPYILTCVIIGTVATVKASIEGKSVGKTFVEWCKAALYGAGDNWTEPFAIKGIGAIWFLLALFFALVTVHYLLDKKYYKGIIIGLAFIGWFSFDKTKVWLPLSIQAGMLASLYVLIGYEAKKEEFIIHNMSRGLLSVLFLIAVFSIQHFKGFWLVHNHLGNGLLDLLGSLAASVIVIALSVYICRHGVIGKHFLQFFGKNSLIILCAHLIELKVLNVSPMSLLFSSALSLNDNHSMLLLILLKIAFVIIAVILINILKKLAFCGMCHVGRKK